MRFGGNNESTSGRLSRPSAAPGTAGGLAGRLGAALNHFLQYRNSSINPALGGANKKQGYSLKTIKFASQLLCAGEIRAIRAASIIRERRVMRRGTRAGRSSFLSFCFSRYINYHICLIAN